VRLGLLLPILLLSGAAVGWVFMAFAARRRTQIAQRLEGVVGGKLSLAAPQPPSIRVRQAESPRLKRFARQLNIPLDLPLAHVLPPGLIVLAGTLLACGTVWVGHFAISWTIGAVAGMVVLVVALRGMFGWELARYQAKLLRQLPDTIQLVVSATRAGLPVAEAFRAIAAEMTSPTRDEFIRVENEMTTGRSPEEALLTLYERTRVTEYAILAVTIGVQAHSGGRLAEAIQNLAETVRERLLITARAKALAGEAKISAIIMCILPVLACLMMSALNPAQMNILFTDPRGLRMFSVGIMTLLLGIATMRQMIKGATRD
jgi:tight adherence protein B